MEDLEKAILHDAQKAIGEAIKTNLTKYNSNFNKLVNEVVLNHQEELKKIIDTNFTKVIKSNDFNNAVRTAFEHKLAKILVQKLEGSVEKCVTTLRSNPTTRAKMILAVEEIIKNTNIKDLN